MIVYFKRRALFSFWVHVWSRVFLAWPCNATLASNYAPHAIASLKYPYMAMLDLNCHVTIQAPDDNKITLTFPTVYFKSSVCYQSGSGITVYDGLDEKAPVISRVCAATTNAYTVNSSSSILHIRFQAKQTAMAFQGVYEFSKFILPEYKREHVSKVVTKLNDGGFIFLIILVCP